MKLFIDARDVSITPHLILDREHDEATHTCIRKLIKPGMHVIEIGANIGYYTLTIALLAGRRGSVLAFECDPILAQLAIDNVEINGFAPIVKVDRRAITDVEGTLEFRRSRDHSGGGTLVPNLEQQATMSPENREIISVEATTLDTVLASYPHTPNVVKIDVEGAESSVLRGGRGLFADTSRPLTVIVEFAPRFIQTGGSDPGQFLDEIASWGFRINAIDERKRRWHSASREALLGTEFANLVLIR
jgi:FkbM family methyltransferase